MARFGIKGVLGLFVFLLFIFVEEYFSILIWVAFYFVGLIISKRLYKDILSKNYFEIFYLIFSILGLIICIDNYYNFGELTGFAGDDTKFLESVKYLVGQGEKPTFKISFFSYVLTLIAFPISLVKTVSLTDLVVFNWFLAGLMAVLLNKLSFYLIGKNIPLLLFILSYPFQFIITDTFTRLYRDNLLIFFLLYGALGIFTEKKGRILFSLVPVGLLRMANLGFLGILYVSKKIRLTKLKSIFVVLFISSIIFINFLPRIVQFAMIYGTDASRIEKYESAFSSLSSEEVMESRFSEAQATENPLMAEAYSKTTFKSIGIRAMFSYFFPLSLRSPVSEMTHSRIGTVSGFYIYRMINWINTLSIAIVFPLIVIGIANNKIPSVNLLISAALLFLLLVLLVSGQGRHSISTYIFNAILSAHGYYMLKEKKEVKQLSLIGTVAMLAAILSYNFYF